MQSALLPAFYWSLKVSANTLSTVTCFLVIAESVNTLSFRKVPYLCRCVTADSSQLDSPRHNSNKPLYSLQSELNKNKNSTPELCFVANIIQCLNKSHLLRRFLDIRSNCYAIVIHYYIIGTWKTTSRDNSQPFDSSQLYQCCSAR